MSRTRPERGDVWRINLELEVEEGTVGREQGESRPALILSSNGFNFSQPDLLIAVPITSRIRHRKHHIIVEPPIGGLTVPSALLCEQIRCISALRLVSYGGMMPKRILEQVADDLFDLLELQLDEEN